MAYSQYQRGSRQARGRREPFHIAEQGFTCVQCGQYVSNSPIVAGVQNRNHCPACLWSRHLDGLRAGDRLSACRAGMRPVGLATKRSRNKYARERDGELMVVHCCTACDKLVLNRIAADDSASALLELFAAAGALDATLETELEGVSILTAHDHDLVRRRLYGGEGAAWPLA